MFKRLWTLALVFTISTAYGYQPWKHVEKLIQQEQWQKVIELTKDSTDTEAQCYYHFVKQKFYLDKPKVLRSLWLVPYSQPKACDRLFKLWAEQDLIGDSEYLQRMLIALSADKVSLAKYLSKSLSDPAKGELAIKLYKTPKAITNLVQQQKVSPMLMLLAIERTAELESADNAEIVYEILKQHHTFSEEETYRVAEILSTFYALEGSYKTNYWFEKISPINPSSETLAWQVRYQLKKQNWSKVKTIILTMHKDDYEKAVWQYWLAQSFKHTNNETTYKVILGKLSEKREFYGMIAALELGKSLPINNGEQNLKDYEIESMQLIMQPIKAKSDRGHYYTSRKLWMSALNHMDEDERLAAAYAAKAWGMPDLSIKTANTLDDQNYLELRFPIHHEKAVESCSSKHDLQPEVIYAMIRQESAFQNHAHSGDGAKGLMQVLPSTARYIGKRKGISGYHRLNNPSKNIQVGCAYLSYLKKKYKHDLILALAAYNMGPGNLKSLLPKANNNKLIWLETLPRAETRRYIKNLIAYKMIYEYLNNKNPKSLSALP
jgi:soluble lytic murein transglycosylase